MEILYNGTPCGNTPRSGYTQQTGLCTKEANISVRRIRRCALHTSTEITGPKLRNIVYLCLDFLCENSSPSQAPVSPRQWPGRPRARSGSSSAHSGGIEKIGLLRPVHAGSPLSPSSPRPSLAQPPQKRANGSHGQTVKSQGMLSRRYCIARELCGGEPYCCKNEYFFSRFRPTMLAAQVAARAAKLGGEKKAQTEMLREERLRACSKLENT